MSDPPAAASVVVVVVGVGLPRRRIEEMGRGETTRLTADGLLTANRGLEAVVGRLESTDCGVVESADGSDDEVVDGRRVGPNRFRIPEETGRRVVDG